MAGDLARAVAHAHGNGDGLARIGLAGGNAHRRTVGAHQGHTVFEPLVAQRRAAAGGHAGQIIFPCHTSLKLYVATRSPYLS